MIAFFSSLFAVALAEFGDKTQFIVLLLTSRFKKPFVIFMAVLLASFFSELLAGVIGIGLHSFISQLPAPHVHPCPS